MWSFLGAVVSHPRPDAVTPPNLLSSPASVPAPHPSLLHLLPSQPCVPAPPLRLPYLLPLSGFRTCSPHQTSVPALPSASVPPSGFHTCPPPASVPAPPSGFRTCSPPPASVPAPPPPGFRTCSPLRLPNLLSPPPSRLLCSHRRRGPPPLCLLHRRDRTSGSNQLVTPTEPCM